MSGKVVLNVVYAHMQPDHVLSMERGSVQVVHTIKPVRGAEAYLYMDAFSYSGRQEGLDVLFLTEPTVVLPGQYNEAIWKQFDHVFTVYDALVERYGFTKCNAPRQGYHLWFGKTKDFAITEDAAERERIYPLARRMEAICLIAGNKGSHVPGELYSKRVEAALWFYRNSDIRLDAYGRLPYFLPVYRGSVDNDRKLDVMSRYKYSLCFENTGDPVFALGYVDKILDYLETRTIPIYLGCPNIDDYIPRGCFIDFRDFAGYSELEQYLKDLSADEYMGYIRSIDDFVCAGGLRKYSWYRLYDQLVDYYARCRGLDAAVLMGSQPEWDACDLPPYESEESPSVWTYEELALAPSPLIDYTASNDHIAVPSPGECIVGALDAAREGNYEKALESMAWLRFNPTADLLLFYAQLLLMAGHPETAAVYLGLSRHFNKDHRPTLRQMRAPGFGKKDFDRALARFEDLIFDRKIENAMVPGLTSVIIPLSSMNDTAVRCIRSVLDGSLQTYEMIVIRDASLDDSRLKDILPDSPRFIVIDSPSDADYAERLNEALRRTSGQYILFLDETTVLLKDTLSRMIECIDRSPAYGISVPVLNSAVGIQQIPGTDTMSFEEFERFSGAFRERNRHRYVRTYDADHLCVLIKRSVVDAIGPGNPEIVLPADVINDLRMRGLVMGYETMIAADSCACVFSETPRFKEADPVFSDLWDELDPHSPVGKALLPCITTKNARDRYGKGSLDDAIKAIMDGIQYAPEEPSLYYCLAEILMDSHLYGQALEALDSLPDGEKELPRFLEMAGHCHFHLDHLEEAEGYASRTLLSYPDSVGSLNLKGLLAIRSGKPDDAKELFRRAITVDPSYADPYVNLGVMLWHEEDARQALDLIEKGFILSPETSDFSTTYHSAVTELNELARAEEVFREAAGFFPGNKTLLFYYIGVLLQRDRSAEAMAATQKAMLAFGVDDGILAAALQIREKVDPLMLSQPGHKGSLSVAMIVKDEEDRIGPCLASLAPVAAELIVVDTGSTDRTKDIARAFGAQVFDLPWTNDFSAARNFSMSKAKGQWILVHDADEVISPRDYGKLRAVLESDPPGPAAYSLVTRNYSIDSIYEGWTPNRGEYPDEESGKGWFPSPKVRLLTNDERFRFENPIHELLEPALRRAGVEIGYCPVVVHHYGQADIERGQMKSQLYYEIGRKKLEADGDTEAALRELAVQARAIDKYDESIELWERYLAIMPGSYLPYFNMSGCYFQKEDFATAYEKALKAYELNPLSKEAAQCYAVTSLFTDEPDKGLKALEDLLATIPDYPTGKMTLGAAYCVTGDRVKGVACLKEMKARAFDCSEALYSLSKKFLAADRIDSAVLLLEGMIESGHVSEQGLALLEDCRNKGK